MANIVYIDNIPIELVINSRARNIKIRINASENVQLVLPNSRHQSKGMEFLKEKILWIKNKTGKIITQDIKPSNEIKILDIVYKIKHNCCEINVPVEIRENRIHISNSIRSDKAQFVLIPMIKKLALEEINKFAVNMAKAMNVKYNKILVKDTISRWGSCSSSGNLSFSWRLALAPRFVLEYVVIHELCHLVEMNHSRKFWNLVQTYDPKYNEARSWLKVNGRKLHKINI